MATVTAPPTLLTPEDYRSTWEPQGWRLLIIGPTSTWRQDWGEWEAIREIVQNALDETENYSWGRDEQGLWIRDVGKGLAVADFLLGPPQPKPAWARGKFGEGMKIGALALLRKGYTVKVDTVGKEIWIVFLRVRVDGEAEQLAALWRCPEPAEGRPDGRRHGTRFHIIGYQGPAFEERFAVNLPREAILHEGPSLLHEPLRRWNQLIGEPFQGVIYARDIYMRDINSPFSYNLWSFELAPDRHAPKEEGAMWKDVGRLWATVTRVDLLRRLLGMVVSPPQEATEESRYLDMSYLGQEPVTGKRYEDFIAEQAYGWQEAWKRKFGEDAILLGPWEDKLARTVEHLGYRPVRVKNDVGDALARAIKTAGTLVKESQERLKEAQTIPDDSLTPLQGAHLRLARKIAARLFIHNPVAGVHAALIPPASDRVRTAGLYGTTTQLIFIAPDQLEKARTTVDTLIHELGHHQSGEEDLTEGHSNAITRVGARVVEHTTQGDFDAELQEAVW